MECSNQRGEAKLIGTLYLSPNENILTIARMRILYFSLFVLYDTEMEVVCFI